MYFDTLTSSRVRLRKCRTLWDKCEPADIGHSVVKQKNAALCAFQFTVIRFRPFTTSLRDSNPLATFFFIYFLVIKEDHLTSIPI